MPDILSTVSLIADRNAVSPARPRGRKVERPKVRGGIFCRVPMPRAKSASSYTTDFLLASLGSYRYGRSRDGAR